MAAVAEPPLLSRCCVEVSVSGCIMGLRSMASVISSRSCPSGTAGSQLIHLGIDPENGAGDKKQSTGRGEVSLG